METEMHGVRSSGGVARTIAALGAMLMLFGLTAGVSMAGDLSAQPANGLDVSGASAAAALAAPQESSWLDGLHVSGFLSQTFAMWQNPSGLRGFTTSRNSLADSRTWLQVDENYRLNENNSFFMREWFVYEPPYAFNSARSEEHTSESSHH